MKPAAEEALEQIIREPKWLGVAMQYMPTRDDAEDAIQEAMIKALRYLEKHDQGDYHRIQILGFWSRCLRWTCINMLRDNKRLPEPIEEIYMGSLFSTDSHNPESLVTTNETLNDLIEAMKLLKPEHQEILAMALNDFSHEEMAEIAGKSVPAMKSCLYRARLALSVRVARAATA